VDKKDFAYDGPDLCRAIKSGLAEARGHFGTQKLSRNGLLFTKDTQQEKFFLGKNRTACGEKPDSLLVGQNRTTCGEKPDSLLVGQNRTSEEENPCSSSVRKSPLNSKQNEMAF
jgi:hypothetical protein